MQRNMSVTVEVGLLSGRTAAVKAGLNGSVGTLKHRAQTALGVGKGRLLDGSGNILGARASIKRAQLQNGDRLTLHISRVQIYTSDAVFAAIRGDGSTVTWGDADTGGDSSHVHNQLQNLQKIQATKGAFA